MTAWLRPVGDACLVMLTGVRPVGEARLVMLFWVSGSYKCLRLCLGDMVLEVTPQASDGTFARSE